MRGKEKTVLKSFDYMHCDDFAKYLCDMAAKGWHFKEWGIGLKFVKGEPENATYAVEVFTKASENDMRPEPHTQEFVEYCEAAGWEFVDAKQKFCIFKKVEENAVDLFAPEERVVNSFKGSTSGMSILLLVLYGLNAFLQWVNGVSFFENNIFSSSFLFSFSIWNLLFLGQACGFLYAFWKKSVLMRRAKSGNKVYIGTWEDGRFRIGMRDLYIVVLLLVLTIYLLMLGKTELVLLNVICISATVIFSIIIAKVRPSSNVNVGIQVIFSVALIFLIFIISFAIIGDNRENTLQQEQLPLQISDYRTFEKEIEDVDVYQNHNLLGSFESYFIFAKGEVVSYNIYRTKHAWILDKIWKDELEGKFNEEVTDCTAEWSAMKALRNKFGIYYIRYENAILVFREHESFYPTQEQIKRICEKLDVK